MTDYDRAFGAGLRTSRRVAGLSQGELAERSGLSIRAVSNLECGRTMWPHPDSVRRLADALGLRGEQQEEFIASASRRLARAAGDAATAIPEPPIAISEAGGTVRFGVLGPVQVTDPTGAVRAVPAAKQRIVLAALLLAAGGVVSAGRLAEALWDASPPNARAAMRTYVTRLRQVLGPAGTRVLSRYPGYLLQAGEDEVDVLRFHRLCRDGGAAVRAGQWGQAWNLLSEGLGLWRGEPLGDVPSDLLRREQVPGLERLRLEAVEWRVDAGLQLGRHGELVAELQSLTAAHPLRERFHSQLMLALVRCGRHSEALAAYQSAREVLAEELGIEPGAGLRELYQQVLTGDRAPAMPQSAALTGSRADIAVPHELPGPVTGFTGRAGELAALTGLLDRPAGQAPEAVVITTIGGTAGVGKTALAVQWAHQVADRFPGGQLYANLRGYDPDRPVPAADALAGFLLSLGVPGQDIPLEEDQRAARYRSMLAGRELLVVLDNAGSAEHVRPLLPGSPGCAVVVTSRDSLAGLVAGHGATRLELDLLPLPDAVGLLRTLIGARVDDDPRAAVTLATQCCRLPLALRVAAELAAARPGAPLATLVGELADQQKRLDLFDAGGDPRTAVRAVFSWSYRHLDAGTARAFRLAGLHPGADFDPYAAAALTGTALEQARRVLDVLARAHLVQSASPGRYVMHDLLRAYARELASRGGEQEQDVALTRLFDQYLHTASMAMEVLHPAERHRRPRILPPDTPVPPIGDLAAARAWLDGERATLVAVTVHAAGQCWPSHATRLSATLFRYLDIGGHYPEAITVHSYARAAAHRTGDQAAEAGALNHLGVVHYRQSRYEQSADQLRQALALFRQTGDRTGQARTLGNLGNIQYLRGRYREAISFHRQALAIFRETSDQYSTGNALNNLGISEERLGRYDLAARHHRQALAIAADIGTRDLESSALGNLGTVGVRQARYQQAADYLDRALALCREIGYRENEAEALTRTADLCARQGLHGEAASHLRQALALRRGLGSRSGEADTLNSLGEVLLATSQPDRARHEHAAALGLATQTGDKYQQARAHHGLGHACHADCDPAGARSHWQQAFALFTELGTPEAGQVPGAAYRSPKLQPPETGGVPIAVGVDGSVPRADVEARPSPLVP